MMVFLIDSYCAYPIVKSFHTKEMVKCYADIRQYILTR